MIKWLKNLFMHNNDHMTLSSTLDHPNAISADNARRFNKQHDMELYQDYLERESGYLDVIFERIKIAAKNGERSIIIRNAALHPDSTDIIIPHYDYDFFIEHNTSYFMKQGYHFNAYDIGPHSTAFNRYIKISW